MGVAHDISPAAARIEALIRELEVTLEGEARHRVEELVRLILELQEAGVSRMLHIVLATDGAQSMLDAFAADPAVATLLASHDLHPHTLTERVEAALGTIAAQLGARVDVRLVSVSGDVARVRVRDPSGIPAASIARIEAVVTAGVEAVAPEVARVLVEFAAPPSPPPLVQISRERRGPHPAARAPAIRLPVLDQAPARHDATGGSCGQCGMPLEENHPHVVDVSARRLVCSCRACWLAVETGSEGRGSSLRAVPPRSSPRPPLRLSRAQWEALEIPVGLAFFTVHGITGQVHGFYPSPAGAVESLLPLPAWQDLVHDNPWLSAMAPDVEALLVRTTRGADQAYRGIVVPVDRCYELVGWLRVRWSGFEGGEGVRGEIDRFFVEHDSTSASCSADRP